MASEAKFLNFIEARALARDRLPRGIFEYIDRGTEDECALKDNRRAFDQIKIKPRVLRARATRSTRINLFGCEYTAPIVVAPTAFAGLVWYRGEAELARAAAEFGIPFCAATEAIASVQEIASSSSAPIWFQLYLWDKENASYDL